MCIRYRDISYFDTFVETYNNIGAAKIAEEIAEAISQ